MSLQIFILGTLSEGDHHPYDIKKMLLTSLDNTMTSINDGTLYYNFDVLLKKGFIKKVEVVQSDKRPEKTTYGITDNGHKALEEDIYSAFKNVSDMKSIYSSLLFLYKVDKNKIAYLIEEAIEKLNKRIQIIEQADTESTVIPIEKRASVQLIVDHAYHSIKTDINWLTNLLNSVRS